MTDIYSERAVLSICLAAADASALLSLPEGAWTDPRHSVISSVLVEKHRNGIPIDPVTVAKSAMAKAGTDHKAKVVSDLVVSLSVHSPPVSSLGYYLDLVNRDATARRLAAQLARTGQMLESLDQDDPSELPRALAGVQTALDDARSRISLAVVEPPMSAAQLLASDDPGHDWLVPMLLERTDRVMLVAPEGVGKTQLLAQVAVTIAAGLHPFTGEPLPFRHPGYRVLVVDCENSKRQLRRRFSRIIAQADALARRGEVETNWDTQLRFVIRPEGVSLTDPRELSRMSQAVEVTQPDLLVIGPLYRLSKVDVRDEQAAKELTDAIDLLRVRHNVTVMCETHAGHAQNGSGHRALRPLGSSLFLRWPEFGLAMRPHETAQNEEHPSLMNLVSWRGSRDERHWPHQLMHGDWLPWVPNESYYANEPLRSVS